MSCGLLIQRSPLAETERAVPLIGTNISVALVDVCAEVTLEQRFVLRASGSAKTRYVLPLADSSFLSGVEVIVDGERRIGVEKDFDEVQRIVDSRKLENAKNMYSFVVGDIPGEKEVRVKCSFTTELNVEGDQIYFSFPAQALPKTIDDQAEGLHISMTIEANSEIVGVLCESHPDKFSTENLLLSDNTAKLRMSLTEGFSASDIAFQHRVKDPYKPRIWTSVGTVQGKRKRVSTLVVYPALAPEKSGLEVVFAIDAHDSVDPCQPSLEAALKSLPQWVTFNIWAHLQNSVFGPVFDTALPSTSANIEHAISKLKSLQTLGGVASVMETLLASPTSGFPRQIYLLTSSKGSRLADLLGLLSKYSTTTRSIVVRNGSHDGKGEVAALVNESMTMDSPRAFEQGFTSKLPPAPTIAANYKSTSRHSCTNELIYCSADTLAYALPGLISRTVVPAQFLTVESIVPDAFSISHSRSAIYQHHVHLFYSTKDDTDSAIDVVVDDASVSVFSTSSSALHHLSALSLLRGEFGYVQDSSEKKQNLMRFCSPWLPFVVPTTAKGKVAPLSLAPNTVVDLMKNRLSPRSPQRSISESSIESPIAVVPLEPKQAKALAAAAMFKTVPTSAASAGKRPALVRAKSTGDDLRRMRLLQHANVQEISAPTTVDYSSRSRIPHGELEAVAMDIAVSLVKTEWEMGRQLSILETQRLRNLVTAIIEGEGPSRHQIILQSETGAVVDVPKLQEALIGSFKRSWTPTLEVGSQHKYRAYAYAEKGGRSHMEDQFVILDNINELVGKPLTFSTPVAFFGVFDGHMGKVAAEYVRVHLPFKLLRSNQFHAAGLTDALREAYLTTDKDFVALAQQDGQKSGSTVVTAVLYDNKIAVSNAGDSEAVLCRNGTAVCLTTCHNPANEKEKIRIEASGGKIFFYGTQRVNGVLAVTRSIGDCQMKDQIIADPDTVIQQLDADDEFLILATDGLWDVLNHQEAVDWVRTEYKKNQQALPGQGFNISKSLTDEALKRGTKDNVTAIVVFFNG